MLIKSGKFAILSGFVPKDAEVRQTQSGKLVVNFSVKRGETEGENGERVAQWLNCVAWQRVGEIAKYISKGDSVLCTGELQERTYDTRDGDTRTVVELVCEYVSVMQPPKAAPGFSVPTVTEPKDKPISLDDLEEVDDDDLPF